MFVRANTGGKTLALPMANTTLEAATINPFRHVRVAASPAIFIIAAGIFPPMGLAISGLTTICSMIQEVGFIPALARHMRGGNRHGLAKTFFFVNEKGSGLCHLVAGDLNNIRFTYMYGMGEDEMVFAKIKL